MKKLVGLLCFAAIISCKETPVNKEIEAVNETVQKTDEKEPTAPEETEIWEPKPPKVTVNKNAAAPSDAIVLFDGSNLDAWYHAQDSTAASWKINDDKSMTVVSGSGFIQTKQNFGSMQLHLEWKSPSKILGEGQSRANSGVFIQQRYEIQILDNNDNDTYVNGQVGAFYKQSIPLAFASVPTGEWNTYDIIFHQPEFNDKGERTKAGTITVLHNGILIQDHFEILGTIQYIGWPKNVPHGKAPLQLQDHNDGSLVSYRNIWLREL